MKRLAAFVAAIAASVLWTLSASAAEVTLTVHHFLGPKSPAHAKFIAPWAKAIEEQSGGRIAVEIFPSMSMGGKPPELYRQVRDGAADVVWTLIGYTPGVFPRSEVFELPTVHKGSALATTLAIQENLDLIADDYKDVKPILVHTHAGQAIHMVDRKIAGPEDLKNLKIRIPSRTGAWVLEAWGAEPVGMPVPALPQALSKGVVDGAMVPFEIFPPLKLHELTKYSHEAVNGGRFGTSVFLFAMNKERYEALPDDLKAVIDANSGAAIAGRIGALWDSIEAPGRAAQEKSGGEVIQLDAAATAQFDALGETVVQRWIAEMNDKGVDGAALVAAARASVEKNTK